MENMITIVWIIIYAGLALLTWWAWSKKMYDPGYVVGQTASFALNVFGPWLTLIYLERLSELLIIKASEADIAIVIHLVLTTAACLSAVIGGGLFFVKALRETEKLPFWRIGCLFVPTIVALMTIFIAAWNPEGFVDRDAYVNSDHILWVWPPMIDATISYFRIFLAATFPLFFYAYTPAKVAK